MANNAAAEAFVPDGNQVFWAQEEAARSYATRGELYPPEQTILGRISAHCRGRPILDLGVGAGRTTAALLPISSDYLGIDYSPAMLARCEERFPGVPFRQADVRDLRSLPDRHYGLIMFSFNGIDYICHDERLRTLGRLQTLLAEDGWLVFSSHNRLCRVPPPWNLHQLTQGPLRKLPGRLWAYGKGIAAYRANRSQAYEGGDHALRIDACFNYELVTYYIAPRDQLAQLRAVGLTAVDVYGMSGQLVDASGSPPDSWLYYAARSGAPRTVTAERSGRA